MKKNEEWQDGVVEEQEEKNEEVWEDVRPKRSVGRIVVNTILVLLIVVFAFNAFFGSLNMKLIYDGNDPYLVTSVENYQDGDTEVQVYHFGLYKIVTRKENNQLKLAFRLWFLDNGDQKS